MQKALALAGWSGTLWANKKLLVSSALYVVERLATSVVSFAVFVILARIYAPDQLGVWTFTLAIVQFAVSLIGSGMEPVVVRRLLAEPERRSETLGSAAVVIALLTICAATIPLVYLTVAHSGQREIVTIGLLAALAFLPQFTLVLEHFLRSTSRASPIVTGRFVAALVGGGGKIALAIGGAPIEALSVFLPIEAAIHAAILVISVRKSSANVTRWRVSPRVMRLLLAPGLPTIAAAIFGTLFFRVNYALLESLSDFTQVGLYSLAFTLLMFVASVPTLALTGLYPKLVEMAGRNRSRFEQVIAWLYFWGQCLGVTAVAVAWATADVLIPILFGARYAASADVLVVMFVALLFVVSGGIRACVINIDGRNGLHTWSALAGLAVLVPAGLALIPLYGAVGAAASIVAGSFVLTVATSFVIPSLRAQGRSQLLGLLLATPFVLRTRGEANEDADRGQVG